MVDAPVHHPAFAEAIALTFRTAVLRLRACLKVAAPYAILVGLFNAATKVSLVVGPSAVTVSEVFVFGVFALVAIAIFIGLSVIAYPLTVGGLSLIGSGEVYGDEISTQGIVKQVVDHAFEAVGAFLLTVLILAVVPVALGLLSVGVALVTKPVTAFAFLVFALVVVLIPQIYVAVRLSLAVPVVMREGVKPVTALRRSWQLVHGTRWAWVFGIAIVVLASVAAVFIGLALLSGALHAHGVLAYVVDFVLGAVEAATATILIGVATGIAYASLAPEGLHVAAQVGAHEVLPAELPPFHATERPEGPPVP